MSARAPCVIVRSWLPPFSASLAEPGREPFSGYRLRATAKVVYRESRP